MINDGKNRIGVMYHPSALSYTTAYLTRLHQASSRLSRQSNTAEIPLKPGSLAGSGPKVAYNLAFGSFTQGQGQLLQVCR
jgi:hypothetical protein